MKQAWQAAVLMIGLMAAGCNGGGSAAPPAASPPAGLLRRAIAELPQVGDYQPPIDGSRLEVAPPIGWNVVRGRTFLIGFAKGKPSELPRITINAEDPPPGSPKELTEEDAAAFAANLDQELKKAKKKVEEFCLPIVLGETLFIRHVRQVPYSGSPCIVQSLQTIKNSRLYTVELIVEIDAPQASQYEASLKKYRNEAYAVAANMRFALPGETIDALAGVKTPAPPKAAEKAQPKDGSPPLTDTKKPTIPAGKTSQTPPKTKTEQPAEKSPN